MKPVDINPSKHIKFNQESNKKGPKFKVCDNVRISKYKNIFAKVYVPNWSEDVFVIKSSMPWISIINEFYGEEIFGKFYKKEIQKINQKGFKVE